MTAPFFNTKERVATLVKCAQSWSGTPFSAHSRVRGAGVDCIHLAAEIYLQCGALADYKFPQYTLDAGAHRNESQVLTWLNSEKKFQEVQVPYQPGDLFCFKLRSVEHHVGILLGADQFIHCWQRQGVLFSNISDPTYRRTLTKVYRPMEEAL